MNDEQEREFFIRGKEVLGKSAGGMLAKIKALCHGDFGKAMRALDIAARKADPREWMGARIRQKLGAGEIGNGYAQSWEIAAKQMRDKLKPIVSDAERNRVGEKMRSWAKELGSLRE